MKSRIISLIALILISFGTAFGQVILTEEDHNNSRATGDPNNIGVMVPAQGWDVDQWKYTPLDGGWLLLSGIGVAYLLRKRRKE